MSSSEGTSSYLCIFSLAVVAWNASLGVFSNVIQFVSVSGKSLELRN